MRAYPPELGSLWPLLIGRRLWWGWILTNQQGYEDGVQLEFAPLEGQPGAEQALKIQLVVAGSAFAVTKIVPA